MILSTNKKLISIGADYSAGQGINITDHIISVVESAVGTNYSAGPNINIYDVEGQPTISSKDWTNDIEQASANAYEQAIAQIPEPQDLSYLSGRIDTNTSGIDYISSVCLTAHQDWTDTIKGASSYSYEQSTSYFDNWISGQYTGDITNITNKITALSGDLGDYYKKTETSSKDEINNALQYVSANAGKVYEGVSPIVVNNVEDKISADTWTFSAGSNVSFVDDNVNKITRIDCTVTGEGGDPQVNSFVYENSATILDVDSSYKANSGNFLTAAPSNMATTGDVAELAQTISETYYPNTNPSSFVNEDWVTAQGYITGVDLSEYAERAFVLSSIESATSGKLDVSSFASVSSDFLTTSFGISESATWNDVSETVQTNSSNWGSEVPTGDFALKSDFTFRDLDYDRHYLTGVSGYNISAAVSNRCNVATNAQRDSDGNYIKYTYYTSAAANTLSSMLSGAIDYVSGQVDNKLDTTSFSDVSSTFLTAVDLSNYYTKNETSGASEIADALANIPTGNPEVESYVQTNSANIDETITSFQTNSSTYMVEPNLEYNAVGEISGYGNSAIAQYGAEKQWLVHDETLCHLANSAQYALGVAIDNVARLMGVDETVLFSGELKLNNQVVLSEKPTNFDRLRFYWVDWNTSLCTHISECSPNYSTSSNYALNGTWYGAAGSTITLFDLKLVDDFDKTITFKYGTFKNLTGSTVNQANESKITKIVGIHRISG